MSRFSIMSSTMAAFVVVALAGSASAAELATQGHTRVAKELVELKRAAFQARDQADILNSFTPNKQLSWQSHAARLSVLRDHVNEMGRSLAELEAMKPMANQTQTLAVENARPHLVSVASNLTDAIDLVNENRRNVYWSDYGKAVRDVYSHADALHTKLDTILKYEKGKARMDNLELQTSLAGQS
ncbi:MAG TPA: hypothetical protein VMS18_19870 [Candidatus Binatia bacterium]|nr:hypothetical protein [Candidatus Binatia bacterium]